MRNVKKQLSALLICAFVITNILSPFSLTNAKQNSENSIAKEKVEVLVKYKDDSKAEGIKTKVKTNLKIDKLESKKKNKNSKIELLQINDNDNLEAVIAELKKDSNVLFAQPNYKLKLESEPSEQDPAKASTEEALVPQMAIQTELPTDDRFSEQWGLLNNGQTIESATGIKGQDISAFDAWSISKGSEALIIGVLDTGIDINHEDLKDNIYTNSSEIPDNSIDDDGNGIIDDINGWDFANGDKTVYDSSEEDFHGTRVAGIIAASENGKGIVGVAPRVKILPLKFISDGIGYTSDAIEAIEYASQMGAKIINCSFSGADNNLALKEAMVASNLLFVCAAGNDGKDISQNPVYPASFELSNILTVGATNNKGEVAELSNFGINVDVAAPGISILSTQPENAYGYQRGTSYSAPYVAAIAALIKSIMPDMTAVQIATRIRSTAIKNAQTRNKIAYGLANANTALKNDQTTSEPIDKNTQNGEDKGVSGESVVSVAAATVSSQLMEEIHYGETGVNIATGNYSKTDTDMSIETPGFTVNFSRTYNSKDDRNTSTMGRGWTFGFEGSLTRDAYYSSNGMVIAKLPNGSTQVFKETKTVDKDKEIYTYMANDSRSTLVIDSESKYYTLTTKDQYTYIFNKTATATTGYLIEMRDRNQNSVKITVDKAGKVEAVTDTVGRVFDITYKSKMQIDQIIDMRGKRYVQYSYNDKNLLETVSAVTATNATPLIIYTYEYDASNYLTKIKDSKGNIIEQITYNHASGVNQHKVTQNTDIFGNTFIYTYNNTDRETKIKDSNTTPREITKKYDSAYYITESKDPEGKISKVEYLLDANNYNKYGEEIKITDRNGGITEYTRDDSGNIIKITNSDQGIEEYTFDSKNNTTMEKDGMGNCTYYIYDPNGIRLIKKVQPLNGTDIYDERADQSKYAITKFTYYTDEEATKLGYKAKGLLKSQIDPTGAETKYTYDANGNQATVTDPEGNVTKNEYNIIGWLTKKTSPSGYMSTFEYDLNGRVIKTVLNNGETSRTTYDIMGRKNQEISPSQYKASEDGLKDAPPVQAYNNNMVGTRYNYNTNGTLDTLIDAEGNKIKYTYDNYGNTLTESLIDKSGVEQYLKSYAYDVMNRLIEVVFKGKTDRVAAILEKYEYFTLSDGKTKKNYYKYLNESLKVATVYIYDYAGRLIEQQNPDGGKITTVYNPNGTVYSTTDAMGNTTYYKYNGQNNLSEQWSPIEEGKYSYQKITYDKACRKTALSTGKDKVELYSIPSSDRLITKSFTYNKDGSLKTETDSSGGKTIYEYDADGNLKRENIFTSKNSYNTTEYTTNHIGKVTSKTIYINKGDLYGNELESTEKQAITTTYTYDSNGNLTLVKTPDNNTTTYTYDVLDRQTSVEKQQINENGQPEKATTEITYDCQGNILTSKDARENTTTNIYSGRGLLLQSTKTLMNADGTQEEHVSAYYYDLAGRKIAEVSPENYKATASSYTDMNRTEYEYDSMDRLIAEREAYKAKAEDTSYTYIMTKGYKYDLNGNLIKEVNGEAYKSVTGTTIDEKISKSYGIESTYNQSGMLETVTDAQTKANGLAYTKKYTYDGAKRKNTETNAKGEIICYYYDDAGNLTSTAIKKSQSDAEQTIGTNTYDLVGNVIAQLDGNGNKTIYEYNAINKLRKTKYPSDTTISEMVVTCQYDKMGNLIKQQDGTGLQKLYTYDNEGRILTQTQQNADGKEKISKSAAYDLNGNKRYETDANGTKIENIYDELNRLIYIKFRTTDINNKKVEHKTQYWYDKNGNQTKEISYIDGIATGSIENIYDSLNRIIEKKDAYSTVQKLKYNANHIQTEAIDAKENSIYYAYDKNNRLISTTDPEGHTTKQNYDSTGNIIEKTDGNGSKTKYSYDQYNRLLQVTNPKGEKTTYTYDKNGNILTQTDGKGNTTTYEYNVANKQIRKTDHGGIKVLEGKISYNQDRTETYNYNANGTLSTKTDRNGKTTIYEYDIHGRLITQKIEGSEIAYTYDGKGNQLIIADETGETTRIYDEAGRVTAKSVPEIGAMTFQYDIIVSRQTVPELTADYTIPVGSTAEKSKDPKGNETTKVTDATGRLIYVISEGKVTAYGYDENGNRSKVVYPDGKTKEEYEYYKDNLLKKLTNTKADGITMDEYSYNYDGAHNQTSKTETINGIIKGTTYYIYDRLNRLIEIQEPKKETEIVGKNTSYTYDATGNRETERTTTSKEAETKTTLTTYKYNEQNRLMSATEETGDGTKKTTTYTYDGNGNMTRKSMEQTKKIDPSNAPKARFGIYIEGQADGATKNAKPIVAGIASYEYNVWNQLSKATTGEGTSNYKYNGEGYRTEKTENGKTTRSLYEADKVILETDANGKEIARNIYGTNLITRIVTEGSSTQDDGSTQKTSYNYMYNGHGDVTALLTQEGTIAASYYYDAFGTAVETHYYNASGEETDKAVNNPYRYAGYVFDSTTDLYYLNARYYDSKISRFLTEDTYTGQINDPLSLNLYTYCANNPVTYFDPTGHRYNFLTGGDDGTGPSIIIGVSDSGFISVPRESNNSGSVFSTPQTSGSITYNYSNLFGNTTLNIENNGDIRTLNTGNLSVNLNNTGTIGKVSTGDKSVTNINNSGYIGVINSGAESRTKITNSGYIGVFNTGTKSTNSVTNNGIIGAVNTGAGNTTTLSGGGYCAYAGGQGTILYNINGVIVPQNIYNKAIIESQKLIDTILSQYCVGFWHGGGYFLVEDTYAYGLYNNLKNEVHGYKFRTSALEASIVPATIYEAYGTVKEQCGPMPPMYTLAATAYVSIFSFLDIDDGTPSLSASDILKELKEKQKESKSVATALAKFNYVMNSDYRYLMLGFEGRGEFKDKLAILNENMNKSDYNIFKNSKDNEAYKTALISYIDNIYNMNVNFSTNNTVLQKILNNVANNVSKVDAKTINEMLYK